MILSILLLSTCSFKLYYNKPFRFLTPKAYSIYTSHLKHSKMVNAVHFRVSNLLSLLQRWQCGMSNKKLIWNLGFNIRLSPHRGGRKQAFFPFTWNVFISLYSNETIDWMHVQCGTRNTDHTNLTSLWWQELKLCTVHVQSSAIRFFCRHLEITLLFLVVHQWSFWATTKWRNWYLNIWRNTLMWVRQSKMKRIAKKHLQPDCKQLWGCCDAATFNNLSPREPRTLAALPSTTIREQPSEDRVLAHHIQPDQSDTWPASQPASHQLVRLFTGSLEGISELHSVSNSQTAAAHTLKC